MALRSSNGPFQGHLNGLSLCSGVGGLELGLHIAEPEYRTVCYVEREAFAASNLVARMEDKALDHAPVWSDLRSFDGHPWRGKIHILSAGYPCQPFSSAGRRKGKADPRHLWPEVARIGKECDAEWIWCENVEGHLDRGFDEVAGELQSMGFSVKAGLFSAAEVGASHLRRRLFILAHSNSRPVRKSRGISVLLGKRSEVTSCGGSERQASCNHECFEDLGGHVGIHEGVGAVSDRSTAVPLFAPAPCDLKAWKQVLSRRMDLQPQFFGLDDGVANRMDRARSAGNGVVSLAAAYAYVSLRTAFERKSGI